MRLASSRPRDGTSKASAGEAESRRNYTFPNTHIGCPRRIETALFRILQEALTNVHRHSGSRTVDVRVDGDDTRVVLTVRDFGMGVPREVLDRFWKTGNVGVGLAGIRERLKELGGSLEIESNLDGTILRATIPLSSADAVEPLSREAFLPPEESTDTLRTRNLKLKSA